MNNKIKNENKEIGRKIKEARKSKGLTQEKVAEMVDMSTGGYGKIERGEVRCTLFNLAKICKKLNLSMDYLLRDIKFEEDDDIVHKLIRDLDIISSYHAEQIIMHLIQLYE